MNDVQQELLTRLTDITEQVVENHRLMRQFADDPFSRHTRSLQILGAQNDQLARITEALCSVLRGTAPETEQTEAFDPENVGDGKFEFIPRVGAAVEN